MNVETAECVWKHVIVLFVVTHALPKIVAAC